VTKDADFADLSTRLGPPPKVIWVRLGNCATQAVENVRRRHHGALVAFEAEPMLGLLILR
jgi:predicted nuclease of predicted toxin-antitoxin system